ncbi:ShlB/FhaC/HecB family hemolysin secretion/activation protein [Brevundimonas pondensis]|uniref:ShlB/FhaC/HecB family hemolysin secretion/activation protein n=1 Tax=Brevundimonas pondensis TaxID=2774189 RepID=A0ABX7SPC4_9CAUL|nr:ShlB/FhaC/HecB family hemolysin secretion/activation protein [Brevundimonas pondensis]
MLDYKRHCALRGAASALALAAVLAVHASPAKAQDEASFEVRAFQVKGNTVLPPEAVERAVYPFMGPGRTSDDVEAARAALQAAYEARGFVAVSVFIPEQSVEGGVLMLEVAEQPIGQVLVEGAKRPDAVRAQAPSLTPGQTPNLPDFQRDVVALNQNPTRRVTPELRAGVAPGTLDVVLAVEETSPWHGSLELNNYSSASTTQLRTAATLRHDNMWGRGDSLSLSAQTAPERTTDGTVYSGNYLMRLGVGTQLLAYAVHSDSDIAVVGGTNVIGKGDLAGLRLIRSLGGGDGFYHSLTLGFDWKSFKEDVILGADRAAAPIEYFPLMASWRGDWSGEARRSDLTFSGVLGVRGLGDDKWAFDAKRYNARQSFFTVKVDASHTEELVHDLQLMAKLSAQWTDRPLISNEQFGIGGSNTVRAYRESEAMGDYGLATQLEMRSPPLLADWPGVDELRLYGFWDAGFVGIHDPLPGQKGENLLMSAGVGGRLRLFQYLNGAVDVGTPLISMPGRDAGLVSVRFRIWGEF